MRKILYTLLGLIGLTACTETVSDATQENILPQIYPDYTGVTIPVNIAPLCFNMADETALRIDAVVTDSHGGSPGIRSASLSRRSTRTAGILINRSPSTSVPTASTTASATV